MATLGGPKIVTNGLVLCLDTANIKSFNGATTWYDQTNNNNDGTLINGPTFNSTNKGSIVFDGINDYILFGSKQLLNSSDKISCFMWINLSQTSSQSPLIFKTLDYSNGWSMHIDSINRLRATLRPSIANSNNVIGGYVSLNTWNYCGFTCDGTTINLYLNAVLISNTTVSNTLNLNITDNLKIGGQEIYGFLGFNGKISLTQIYNRGLTQEEIIQNYNATKNRFI